MWQSRSDFQGLGNNEGKPGSGFPSFSTARHFHSAPEVSCAFPFLVQSAEQLVFCFLHGLRRFGIALFPRHPVQRAQVEFRFQLRPSFQSRHQPSQRFPRRGVAPVYELFFSARIRDSFRLSETPRSAIMIIRSRRLSLKLVYQVTHEMMICPSKCRPLNTVSIGLNRSIPHHRPVNTRLHQNHQTRTPRRRG